MNSKISNNRCIVNVSSLIVYATRVIKTWDTIYILKLFIFFCGATTTHMGPDTTSLMLFDDLRILYYITSFLCI